MTLSCFCLSLCFHPNRNTSWNWNFRAKKVGFTDVEDVLLTNLQDPRRMLLNSCNILKVWCFLWLSSMLKWPFWLSSSTGPWITAVAESRGHSSGPSWSEIAGWRFFARGRSIKQIQCHGASFELCLGRCENLSEGVHVLFGCLSASQVLIFGAGQIQRRGPDGAWRWRMEVNQ